ncbi:MAG TPA: RNA-binding protein [Bdellovibrionota bacterium]|nr:RNA-binding protein [Bdellovibrionota bacterium]
MTNKKLYVGNLPLSTEEHQLHSLFAKDGRRVVSVKIFSDRKTGHSRGFAFIEMATTQDALGAIEALNGRDFMGRPLAVDQAREGTEKRSHHPRRTGRPGRYFRT